MKICPLQLKIDKIFEMRAKCEKNVKFYAVEKRGSLGVDCIKNGVSGCKICEKKGVIIQAEDIGRHMGVPPPRIKRKQKHLPYDKDKLRYLVVFVFIPTFPLQCGCKNTDVRMLM